MSERIACHLAGRIREISRLPSHKRERRISRDARHSLDAASFLAEWERFHAVVRPLAWVSACLFAFAFFLSPIAIALFGAVRLWPYLLVELVCLTISVVILYVHAHKRLFGRSRPGPWMDAISMLLFPPAAMRSVDRLSQDVAASHSAVAVVLALCDPTEAGEFVRRQAIDLQADGTSEPVDEATACRQWFAALVLRELIEQSKQSGMEIFRAPQREEGMHAYCPKCHSQFRHVDGACDDCSGVGLRTFDGVGRKMDTKHQVDVDHA
jgi:hypothetical protein